MFKAGWIKGKREERFARGRRRGVVSRKALKSEAFGKCLDDCKQSPMSIISKKRCAVESKWKRGD